LQRAARTLTDEPEYGARERSRENRYSMLRTIFFDSGHLQCERERPDMKRKYMNCDKAQ